MSDTRMIFSAFQNSQPGAWVEDGMIIPPAPEPAAKPEQVSRSRSQLRSVTITVASVLTFLMVPVIPVHGGGSGPIAVIMAPDPAGTPHQESFLVFPGGYLNQVRDYLRTLPQAPQRTNPDLDYFV